MRLFVAIDVPRDIVETLLAAQAKLVQTKAAVRWVAGKQFHITVKFLAEVPGELLGEVSARVTRAAAEVPAFPLEIAGLGRFPERGPARTIVARVVSPDQRLTKLHRLIDSALGGIGLPLDTRVLTPHLTLGRVVTNHGLNRLLRLLEKHQGDFFGEFTAERVTVYGSVLGQEGAVHTALHAAPLASQAAGESPTGDGRISPAP